MRGLEKAPGAAQARPGRAPRLGGFSPSHPAPGPCEEHDHFHILEHSSDALEGIAGRAHRPRRASNGRSFHVDHLILNTDSYKVSHWVQYPPGMDGMFSYIESRGGLYDRSVFFGLQAILKEYLTRPVTASDIVERYSATASCSRSGRWQKCARGRRHDRRAGDCVRLQLPTGERGPYASRMRDPSPGGLDHAAPRPAEAASDDRYPLFNPLSRRTSLYYRRDLSHMLSHMPGE